MGAVVVKFVENVLYLAAGDVDAEVIAGDTFHGVGFVENDDVIIWQDAGSDAAERDIAEQQRMIDDQDLSILRAAAILIVKALVVRRAATAQAVAAVAGEFFPNGA